MIIFCQQTLKYIDAQSKQININSVFQQISWHSGVTHSPENCFFYLH